MNITIITISILILITLLFLNNKEHYQTPYLIYDVYINPNILNIIYNTWNSTSTINQIVGKNIAINHKNKQFKLYLTDVYSYSKSKNYKALTILPDKKLAMFLRKKSTTKTLDISNIESIGYFNDIDLDIINFILKACNVNKLPILKQITFNNKINNAIYDFNKIDSIFIFTSLHNPINITDPFDIVDYNPNIHKIKFFLPYCTIENIDLTTYYPRKYSADFPMKSYIGIDFVLSGDEHNDEFINEYKHIINVFNNLDQINYYTLYIDFFDITMDLLNVYNQHVIDRSKLQILEQFSTEQFSAEQFSTEQFSAEQFSTEPLNNVHGFFTNNTLLLSNNNFIEQIPLSNNDIVILRNQDRDEENGTYVFESPNILKKQPSKTEKRNKFDPRFECYNHLEIATSGLCQSEYDAIGQNKKPVYIWDRRCEKNEECPYYQKNKHYNNYRGGCLDGYCEMPVGMSNVSYRIGTGKPYCHGSITCQENPDYAFELDSFQRNFYKQ
jgi:hypothetical protein